MLLCLVARKLQGMWLNRLVHTSHFIHRPDLRIYQVYYARPGHTYNNVSLYDVY